MKKNQNHPRLKKVCSAKMFGKIFHFGVIAIFGGLFLRQAVLCIMRFFKNETVVSLDIMSISEAVFPAITICPAYEEPYKLDQLAKYNLSLDRFRKDFKFPKVENLTDFYTRASFDLTELVDSFYINTARSMEGTPYNVFWYDSRPNVDHSLDAVNFRKKFLITNPNDWTVQHYNIYGRCYSYNPPDEIGKLSIINNEFYLNRNSHVFMHFPGQFSHTDSKSKVVVNKGEKNYVDIYYDVTKSLSLKINDTCEQFSCLNSLDFGYDFCIRNEVNKNMIKKFGCVPPHFPQPENMTESKIPECKLANYSNEKIVDYRDSFLALYQDGVRDTACIQPCTTMTVSLGFPVKDGNSSFARIKFYFRSNIKVYTSSFGYSALSMLADVGGYIGLLLGYSCKDLIPVFEVLFIRRKMS